MKGYNGQEDQMKGYEVSDGAVFQVSSPSLPGWTRITELTVTELQVTILKNHLGNVSHRVFVSYHLSEVEKDEAGENIGSPREADVARKPLILFQKILMAEDWKQVR